MLCHPRYRAISWIWQKIQMQNADIHIDRCSSPLERFHSFLLHCTSQVMYFQTVGVSSIMSFGGSGYFCQLSPVRIVFFWHFYEAFFLSRCGYSDKRESGLGIFRWLIRTHWHDSESWTHTHHNNHCTNTDSMSHSSDKYIPYEIILHPFILLDALDARERERGDRYYIIRVVSQGSHI